MVINSLQLARKRIGEEGFYRFPYIFRKFLLYRYIVLKRRLKFRYLRTKTRNRFLLKNVQGSKMYLDLKDDGISKELALDGIRESESTRIVQQETNPGDVIVDIGANMGYYLLMEARLAGQGGKVYGIEPVPDNFDMLKRNVEINGLANVELFQMGIGDRNGLSSINISKKSNWSSMVYSEDIGIMSKAVVQISTLDSFLKDKRDPDFIRMDVEGYEYEIMKGMESIIESNKPLRLFIELHPHHMGKEKTSYILNFLKKNGFQATNIIKSWTREQELSKGKPPNYSLKTIDDLLKDDLLLNGNRGAFEIFFERK